MLNSRLSLAHIADYNTDCDEFPIVQLSMALSIY